MEIIAVIAILTTSSLAANRTVTYYSEIPNQTVNWPPNQKHTFPYFDSDMGRLIRIDFTATLNGSMNGTTENRNIASGVDESYFQDRTRLSVQMINGDWLNLSVDLRVPDAGSVELQPFTLPYWAGSDTLSGYDYGEDHDSINYTLAGDLADYIGTGTFDLPGRATAQTSTIGGGVQVSDIRTYGWSNATITYTYDDSRCLSGYKIDRCTGLPLSGWTINVNNSTQSWTATTDGNGFWRTCSLENDTYTICEAPQSGWTQTSSPICHTVTLAGINITNINFTNQMLYCISGYKLDACNNTPLSGWNITLQNATSTISQLTGLDGKYEFCNLRPENYTITEELRPGYIAVSVVTNPVKLNCSNITGQNFTNHRLLCISGKKINHCTGNGLSGWTINVMNSSGAIVGTSTTINTPVAQRGNWEVCGLLPGNYTVTETLKPGYLNITNLTQNVTLDCVNVTGIDFRNVPLFGLGGYKLDNCTGERLAGWDISVKNLSTGVTITVTTLNTPTNRGRWRVTNLAPGLYQVTEIMKPGYFNITPNVVDVTLGCANNYSIDFTNQRLLCISGYKIDDCTDAGLSGWTVTLTNGTYTVSTSTNETGYYEFCGLLRQSRTAGTQ